MQTNIGILASAAVSQGQSRRQRRRQSHRQSQQSDTLDWPGIERIRRNAQRFGRSLGDDTAGSLTVRRPWPSGHGSGTLNVSR